MSRIASVVFAVSLVLYGASCFILPASTPRAPQQGAASAVGQPSASAAPESAGSWSPVAIGAALGLLAAVATARPALAADLENGESIFQGNCTACHAGGNNTIVAEKKLKKDALVTYGKYDVGAIITQVTNGNGAMPAFGDKLGPDDIEEPLPDLPVCILGVACRFDLADSKFRIPVVIEGLRYLVAGGEKKCCALQFNSLTILPGCGKLGLQQGWQVVSAQEPYFSLLQDEVASCA